MFVERSRRFISSSGRGLRKSVTPTSFRSYENALMNSSINLSLLPHSIIHRSPFPFRLLQDIWGVNCANNSFGYSSTHLFIRAMIRLFRVNWPPSTWRVISPFCPTTRLTGFSPYLMISDPGEQPKTSMAKVRLLHFRVSYEIWNNIAIPNSLILGWEPWELSEVFNPDPSQQSYNKCSRTLDNFSPASCSQRLSNQLIQY